MTHSQSAEALRLREYRASLSPEKLIAMRLKAKTRWQSLSEAEQKRRNEAHRRWKANLSPERLKQYRDGRHQYAKEQRKLRPEFFAAQDQLEYATRQQKFQHGLCTMTQACPASIAGKTRFCIKHWIMIIAAAANGRSSTRVRYRAVLDLWEQQRGLCPVTGMLLVPGVNAHLDHIVPRGRGGAHEIGNLRFVHETFNRMKDDLLDSELKDFIAAAGSALLEWSKRS